MADTDSKRHQTTPRELRRGPAKPYRRYRRRQSHPQRFHRRRHPLAQA